MKRIIPVALSIAVDLVLTARPSAGAGGDGGNDGGESSEVVVFTVTYDPNGANTGTVPADPATYNEGTQVTVLDNTGDLTLEGFPFFIGWNTASDGSGEEYLGGETFSATENVTLYASWIPAGLIESPAPGSSGFFGFGAAGAAYHVRYR